MDPRIAANQSAFARLLEHNITPNEYRIEEFAVEDVQIIARIIPKRTGVPTKADTVEYHLIHSDWELQGRAVWLDGQLFQPVAVHCPVTDYLAPDNEPELPRDIIIQRVNEWFCGCSAI